MNELQQKLKTALAYFCTRNGASTTDFEIRVGLTHLGRTYGILIWSRFDSMEVSERQNKLWEFLRSELSTEDARDVSYVYTRGVEEWEMEGETA